VKDHIPSWIVKKSFAAFARDENLVPELETVDGRFR
jgi:hypothetical protein